MAYEQDDEGRVKAHLTPDQIETLLFLVARWRGDLTNGNLGRKPKTDELAKLDMITYELRQAGT